MKRRQEHWTRGDTLLALGIALLALGFRLPHWQTIPPAGDEVNQAIYAYQIARDQMRPLVANDAYIGPFYVYLLAVLIRLGVTAPLVGRTIALLTGSAMATLTYAWARRLRATRPAALIAGLLVATNPHLILLNGHLGGSTFLMPFLALVFLWALTRAVEMDSVPWLGGAAVAAGLAIQANPVAGLIVASGWLWATGRARRSPRLGTRWPLWPVVMGFGVVLVYSPVIIYNLTSSLDSVDVVYQRSYLWESSPTIRTFLKNELRLALQLVRQTAGVLLGDETPGTVLGWPLLYAAWMVAGMIVASRRLSWLPLVVLLPFFLIFPVFSSHYGMVHPVRFTTLVTPVLAVGMGTLLEAAIAGTDRLAQPARTWARAGSWVLGIVLALAPLGPLFRYYAAVEAQHKSGWALLELSRQMAASEGDEPAYIGHDDTIMVVRGIPYVPRAYLLFANRYQDFIPADVIIGRLFEVPGRAFLLLSDADAEIVGQVAPLVPWPGAANEEAHRQGFGLYTVEGDTPPVRPDFVLTGEEAAAIAPAIDVQALVGDRITLIGYDGVTRASRGETLTLTLYWRAEETVPYATYIGFAHLVDPATGGLIAQDDHLLGRERYPLNAWRSDEVIADSYTLPLPQDVAPGTYLLYAGIYTWPDLTRLEVPAHPDDVVELGMMEVTGRE